MCITRISLGVPAFVAPRRYIRSRPELPSQADKLPGPGKPLACLAVGADGEELWALFEQRIEVLARLVVAVTLGFKMSDAAVRVANAAGKDYRMSLFLP